MSESKKSGVGTLVWFATLFVGGIFATIGLVASGAFVALALGFVSMDQVTSALQSGIDQCDYWLAGIGGLPTIATLIRSLPMLMEMMRNRRVSRENELMQRFDSLVTQRLTERQNSLAELVKRQVSEQLA